MKTQKQITLIFNVVHPDGSKIKAKWIDQRLKELLTEHQNSHQPDDFYITSPMVIGMKTIGEKWP